MTNETRRARRGRILSIAVALALAGCGGTQSRDAAQVEIRGSDPSGARSGGQARGALPVSGEGIVSYDGYQAARAREGDTVSSLASRIGLSAAELGAYNGLSPTHPLREGDELVLPPRPDGYRVAEAPSAVASSPAPRSSIEAVPLDPTGPAGQQQGLATGSGTAAAAAAEVDGGLAASAAPAASPLPGESGWSPELAAAAIARSGTGQPGTDPATVRPGERVEVPAPPSAGAPLPGNPPPVRDLASPNLSQYQRSVAAETQTGEAVVLATPTPGAGEPAAPAARLQRPVDGPVALGFRQGAGGVRNDGVDFAAPAGAPVVAAADGEVALVSEALGGLGTIVLLRHPNDLLTVYGRISGVSVGRGDLVSRGQQIGVVARPEGGVEPRMHFEVREGANSVDPMTYF